MVIRWAFTAILALQLLTDATQAQAQAASVPPKVHIIWMGGNDCPPCKWWRGSELPKLQKSAEFSQVRFSYVTKTVESAVPASFFLPDEVKPYKDKLDLAGGGGPGSPQVAILVNGEVYDYFWGTRTAPEIEAMLSAIRSGTPYPFRRCTKMLSRGRACDVHG